MLCAGLYDARCNQGRQHDIPHALGHRRLFQRVFPGVRINGSFTANPFAADFFYDIFSIVNSGLWTT